MRKLFVQLKWCKSVEEEMYLYCNNHTHIHAFIKPERMLEAGFTCSNNGWICALWGYYVIHFALYNNLIIRRQQNIRVVISNNYTITNSRDRKATFAKIPTKFCAIDNTSRISSVTILSDTIIFDLINKFVPRVISKQGLLLPFLSHNKQRVKTPRTTKLWPSLQTMTKPPNYDQASKDNY